MASRCRFNKSSEIGAFCLLTNRFALVPYCDETFLNYFMKNLSNEFPVIQTSIANTSIIGRLAIGNRHGLLLPSIIEEDEVECIAKDLPENIKIGITNEPFSALGNVISCNDKIALVNPSLNKETRNLIEETLLVETIPFSVFPKNNLIGTYTRITNNGGVISKDVKAETIEKLEEITGINFIPTQVNQGSNLISAGICANNSTLICGSKTTAIEMSVLEKAFYIDTFSEESESQITDISTLI